MLTLKIQSRELFIEEKNEFFQIPETVLNLEHSLASIAEWESKWHKPFLDDKKKKTNIEMMDYIQCMTVGQRPKPIVYTNLSEKQLKEILDYMENPMTAATFKKNNNPGVGNSGEFVSAETIYYQMIQLGIPFECQYWHLKRLLALLKYANAKASGPKKMSQKEEQEYRRAVMAKRRAKNHGRG